MRYLLIVFFALLGAATSAVAQLSVGIGLPGVSIGINMPYYPQMVRVPGYPVYYAPQLDSNFFFYDGMYWVYQRDNWYASSWYDGPWGLVTPDLVPLFVLRVPVRYYRNPPVYFGGWRADTAPRWGEHWGNDWERQHSGWNQWNRRATPAPAPLPTYQRRYSGERYPATEQQHSIQGQNYRYQPRDAVVQQHYQQQGIQRAPMPDQRAPQGGTVAPRAQPPQQQRGEEAQRSAPPQAPARQKESGAQEQRQRPQQGPQQGQQRDREKGDGRVDERAK
jgi:hypothetical protein